MLRTQMHVAFAPRGLDRSSQGQQQDRLHANLFMLHMNTAITPRNPPQLTQVSKGNLGRNAGAHARTASVHRTLSRPILAVCHL